MKLGRRISLATTQLDATPAPLAERLGGAEALIRQAAGAGAQLVVLPEVFNSGYAYRNENFALAEMPDGPTAQWMRRISARLGVHLAGSLFLARGARDLQQPAALRPRWTSLALRQELSLGLGARLFPRAALDYGCRNRSGRDWVDALLGHGACGPVAAVCRQSGPDAGVQLPAGHPRSHLSLPGWLTRVRRSMGPVFGSLRQSARRVFVDTPAQQTAWLGVPFISSTACGTVCTPIPNPLGSFLGLLPSAPWLIRCLPKIRQVEVSARLVEAARIFAADGSQLAELHNEQGDAFVMGEVSLPAERPQPHLPQPKPPVPWLVYLVSDRLLTTVSLGTYARRK